MKHRRLSLALLVVGLAGLTTLGCSNRFQKMVTTRAVTDFQCTEPEITLKRTQTSMAQGLYEANGCGKQDEYYTKCNLLGFCKILSSAELAAYNAQVDRQNAAYYQNTGSRPPASSSSPSSSSPKPASASSPKPASSSSSSLPKNCSFASDCGPGVKCNSGRCANTAGSSCGFDTDCGGNGAKCHSGKCSNAPDGRCAFDSECGKGGKCSSGTCR